MSGEHKLQERGRRSVDERNQSQLIECREILTSSRFMGASYFGLGFIYLTLLNRIHPDLINLLEDKLITKFLKLVPVTWPTLCLLIFLSIIIAVSLGQALLMIVAGCIKSYVKRGNCKTKTRMGIYYIN